MQDVPPVQLTPQAPQLLASPPVSTHMLAQVVVGGWHMATHVPPLQD
jgi:hypothetical protein